MRLAASNIGWKEEQDEVVLQSMVELGFQGLEIAPTKLFPEKPYERLADAQAYAKKLRREYGLSVCSMQSIWYGRTEMIAGSRDDREALLEYTRKAVHFACAMECDNLVFGCPRNRAVRTEKDIPLVEEFLSSCGEYAARYGVVIALEPNPPIYHTNYLNTTEQAIALIRKLDVPGLRLNLDFGTVIENKEDLDWIHTDGGLIHHVHISEPGLGPILSRTWHSELINRLSASSYNGFVSLEMGAKDQTAQIIMALNYLKTICQNKDFDS